MAILFPCGLKVNEIAPILVALTGAEELPVISISLQVLAAVSVIFSLVLFYKKILYCEGRPVSRDTISELMLCAALCFIAVKASPLVSFVLYFCGYHSLESTIRDTFSFSQGGGYRQGLRTFLLLSAVPTAVTIIFGIWLYLHLIAGGASLAQSIARALFVTLACVTVPHVLLKIGFFSKLSIRRLVGMVTR